MLVNWGLDILAEIFKLGIRCRGRPLKCNTDAGSTMKYN